MRRGLVFLTAVVAGLAWVLPAGMAHAADLSNGSTAYSQIGDCPDGVGAVSVGPTTPPLFVNHMGFGAEVGTVASQCATPHFTLAVKATLFTASSDNPSLEGVAVAQVLESCNNCQRVIGFGTATPAPGLYRIEGDFSVTDVDPTTGATTVTRGHITGPTFLYDVIDQPCALPAAPPSDVCGHTPPSGP